MSQQVETRLANDQWYHVSGSFKQCWKGGGKA